MVDFEQVYLAFRKKLIAFAYTIVHDWHEAEDVVQDALIKAYKKMDAMDDSKKVGAWLYTITLRTAIDFKRTDKRRNWAEADLSLVDYYYFQSGHWENAEAEAEIKLFQEELRRSIDGLSATYRSVLLLKWKYDLKETEIAAILQLKSATVKTRLHRARKQLREALLVKDTA